MAYNATSTISDKCVSERAKTLYLLLAKTMSDIAQGPVSIGDFRSMVYHINQTKENLLDVSTSTAKRLAGRINGHLDGGLQNAEEMIVQIESEIEVDKKRQTYILSQLSDHEAPWNNRSFLIECPSSEDFLILDENKKPFVDNEKVARSAYDELSKRISPTRFRLMLIGRKGRVNSQETLNTCAIVTFSEADETLIREAMVDITRAYLQEHRETFAYRSTQDAKDLANKFPFQFGNASDHESAGHLTVDILSVTNPQNTLKKIPFQEQFVLMDIEHYANRCSKLREFIQDPFGGIYGKKETGFRKAMNRCMELYLADKGPSVNLDKLTKALDREMEAAATFQKIAPKAAVPSL